MLGLINTPSGFFERIVGVRFISFVSFCCINLATVLLRDCQLMIVLCCRYLNPKVDNGKVHPALTVVEEVSSVHRLVDESSLFSLKDTLTTFS